VGRKPPPPSAQMQLFQDTVNAVSVKYGKEHVKRRKRIVSGWSASTQPTFSWLVSAQILKTTLIVKAREKDSGRPIWFWIDVSGTRPHRIPGPVSFPWSGTGSYQARTHANPPRFGGTGAVRNPKQVTFQFVNHPGFPARKFSEDINTELTPEYLEDIRTGGSDALNKAKSGR